MELSPHDARVQGRKPHIPGIAGRNEKVGKAPRVGPEQERILRRGADPLVARGYARTEVLRVESKTRRVGIEPGIRLVAEALRVIHEVRIRSVGKGLFSA